MKFLVASITTVVLLFEVDAKPTTEQLDSDNYQDVCVGVLYDPVNIMMQAFQSMPNGIGTDDLKMLGNRICHGYIVRIPEDYMKNLKLQIKDEMDMTLKKLSTKMIQREGVRESKDLKEPAELSVEINGIPLGIIRSYLKQQRRAQKTSMVEVGPGAYKSEIIEYPRDKFKSDLKKLMAIKKAMEKSGI